MPTYVGNMSASCEQCRHTENATSFALLQPNNGRLQINQRDTTTKVYTATARNTGMAYKSIELNDISSDDEDSDIDDATIIVNTTSAATYTTTTDQPLSSGKKNVRGHLFLL
jgi:shikimate 5-dehydrogenase